MDTEAFISIFWNIIVPLVGIGLGIWAKHAHGKTKKYLETAIEVIENAPPRTSRSIKKHIKNGMQGKGLNLDFDKIVQKKIHTKKPKLKSNFGLS